MRPNPAEGRPHAPSDICRNSCDCRIICRKRGSSLARLVRLGPDGSERRSECRAGLQARLERLAMGGAMLSDGSALLCAAGLLRTTPYPQAPSSSSPAPSPPSASPLTVMQEINRCSQRRLYQKWVTPASHSGSGRHRRPLAKNGRNETCPRVGMRLAAWLKDVA